MGPVNVAFYIPKDFARADAEDRVNLLKDLQPLIEKLEETRPFADSKKSAGNLTTFATPKT